MANELSTSLPVDPEARDFYPPIFLAGSEVGSDNGQDWRQLVVQVVLHGLIREGDLVPVEDEQVVLVAVDGPEGIGRNPGDTYSQN